MIGNVLGAATGALKGAVDGFTGGGSAGGAAGGGSDFSGLQAIFDKAKADNEQITAVNQQGNVDVRAAKVVPQ